MKNFRLLLLFLICSSTFSLTAQPTIQWQKCLGGTNDDQASSIRQTFDGGYIIAGTSRSNDGDVTGNHGGSGWDYWVVKINPIGNIQWQKCLGGTNDDWASSIQQTTDSGYIVAGRSLSNDGDVTGNHIGPFLGADYWVVKLNNIGNIQWQKCLGGTDMDWANSIQQTTDSGFIVAGWTNSNDGDVTGNHSGSGGAQDYWVVKLNSVGNIQWQKCLGGYHMDAASSIQQTTDGGYIVAGCSNSYDGQVTSNHGAYDYWIVKLDTSGSIQWQKSLGGSATDNANSIQQTTDSGYIVAGRSGSNDGDVTGNHGSFDYWIVKLNRIGNIQWQKSLGGTNRDEAYSVQQTTDDGYIIAGYTQSNDGDVTGHHDTLDFWIVKLDSVGTIRWQKCLGGTGIDLATSIQQTNDNGYVIAGYTQSNDDDVTGNHGNNDYWVVKLSPIIGIEENTSAIIYLEIIPNPFTTSLTLKGTTTKGEVTIYDVAGREILWSKTFTDETKIATGFISRGFYVLKYTEENKTANFKLTKF